MTLCIRTMLPTPVTSEGPAGMLTSWIPAHASLKAGYATREDTLRPLEQLKAAVCWVCGWN
jgi:hypothetical protein